MFDWLVRWWRVEVALWTCYWDALRRGDRYSYQYCAEHSLLVFAFWLIMLLAPFMLMALFE